MYSNTMCVPFEPSCTMTHVQQLLCVLFRQCITIIFLHTHVRGFVLAKVFMLTGSYMAMKFGRSSLTLFLLAATFNYESKALT